MSLQCLFCGIIWGILAILLRKSGRNLHWVHLDPSFLAGRLLIVAFLSLRVTNCLSDLDLTFVNSTYWEDYPFLLAFPILWIVGFKICPYGSLDFPWCLLWCPFSSLILLIWILLFFNQSGLLFDSANWFSQRIKSLLHWFFASILLISALSLVTSCYLLPLCHFFFLF